MHFTTCYFYVTKDYFIYFYPYGFHVLYLFFCSLLWLAIRWQYSFSLFHFLSLFSFSLNLLIIVTTRYALQFCLTPTYATPLLSLCFALLQLFWPHPTASRHYQLVNNETWIPDVCLFLERLGILIEFLLFSIGTHPKPRHPSFHG